MKRANEIFEQGMKKVCGNASYYQEIQNAVDEVTKGKIKEEHTRDRFLLANRIYEINQKTFGKSW